MTTEPRASEFRHQELFVLARREAPYRRLTQDHVRTASFEGREILVVEPAALTLLAREAFRDVSFLLRPKQLGQWRAILEDPLSGENDKAVARELLRNAIVAARRDLPLCQDTGTATVVGKKGQSVWTGGEDSEALARGIWEAYARENLRHSQVAPLTLYDEKNTGNNLPPQIDLYAVGGGAYEFLFIAKGGGSANKTYLFQETKAVLTPQALKAYLTEKMATLGTAACPPYHVVFAIGGTSAEATLKTVKLASAEYLDGLPASGDGSGRAFRDAAFEAELLEAARALGIGAQFGGRHFALDVRVVRLPRHGASCPIGMGVSCSAHRNVLGRIDAGGVWLEQLETRPESYLPAQPAAKDTGAVAVDLNRPMREILAQLARYPVATRLALTGKLVVARDMAHAKLKERVDRGQGVPAYFKDHPVYYAGPAKKPDGKASGSFGPTTSGRMDAYVDAFQSLGASMVMLGKGNRSPQVAEACRKHGGFYLGSIGGAAAILAEECILKVEVIDFPELGMESVWAIDVVDFPAFILTDDKGNDFFRPAKDKGPKSQLTSP
ncbi:MAG: fumarate hydratase C-terminal domain-containing protein [Elusimicrobia bacterium]|nr:fumarate hydratase C-terminal domain-containing protein [Elusimicrobiota bacterium]